MELSPTKGETGKIAMRYLEGPFENLLQKSEWVSHSLRNSKYPHRP